MPAPSSPAKEAELARAKLKELGLDGGLLLLTLEEVNWGTY
jgi:hypothetical protein